MVPTLMRHLRLTLLVSLLALAAVGARAQPTFNGPLTPGSRQATPQDIINALNGAAKAVNGTLTNPLLINPTLQSPLAQAMGGLGATSLGAATMTPTGGSPGALSALLSGNAGLPGLLLTGNPSLQTSFAGETPYNTLFVNVTGANGTQPEHAAMFQIAGTAGYATGAYAYKAALVAQAIVNPGSAFGFGANIVCTLSASLLGSVGCIGAEFDVNNGNGNSFGLISGSSFNVGLLVNGTGGYTNNAGIYVTSNNGSYSQWDYGIVVAQGSLGYAQPSARTASFLDSTNSPTEFLGEGAHSYGVHLAAATFSHNAFDSPGFAVSGLGAETIGGAQADSAGQLLSVTGSVPSPSTFATIYDPVRSIIGPFTASMEFGGGIGLGDANAIVGGIVCPSNILVAAGTYCGGISGYAYNMAASPSGGGAVATATGVAGYGGFGVTGGYAWGLVGFATNCLGATCPTRTGFGGSSTNHAGLTSQENDLVTYLLPSGSSPDYGSVTGLTISGTADNQARWSRAHSSVYGLLMQVLDTNNYATTPCDGTGTQSHCWDADFVTADGSSFVALQIGALQTNVGGITAASQNLTFSAYNAGAGVLGTMYLNPSGEFVMQTQTSGSIALTAAGTILLEVSNASPAVATTSLTLRVNSPTGGIELAPVTMAGANTGGTGYRALVIPN